MFIISSNSIVVVVCGSKGERIYLIDLSAAYLIWDLSGATAVNDRWKETDSNGFFYVTV